MAEFYDIDEVVAGTQAAIAHYKSQRGITGTTYLWEGIEEGVRVVLDAVAPLIAARALRDAAEEIRDGYTCDPTKTPRSSDLECQAFDDAIQYLLATADEIEKDGKA